MPKVGSKTFNYTRSGVAAAKQEAARTGQKVHYEPPTKPKPAKRSSKG